MIPFLEFLLPRSFLLPCCSTSSILSSLPASAPPPCALLSPPFFSRLLCPPLCSVFSLSPPPFNFLSYCLPTPHHFCPAIFRPLSSHASPSCPRRRLGRSDVRQNSPPSNRQYTYRTIQYAQTAHAASLSENISTPRTGGVWTRRGLNEIFVFNKCPYGRDARIFIERHLRARARRGEYSNPTALEPETPNSVSTR